MVTDNRQIVNSNVTLKKIHFILFAFKKFQAQDMLWWKEFSGFFDELFKPDTSHADFGKQRLIKNQIKNLDLTPWPLLPGNNLKFTYVDIVNNVVIL